MSEIPSERELYHIHRERKSKREVDQLMGLLGGIMADGILNVAEVEFLFDWLKANEECRNEYPAKQVFGELVKIFEDGIVSDEELRDLQTFLRRISPERTIATSVQTPSVPYDNNNRPIDFSGSAFCFTGDFVFGPRKACEDVTLALGGLVQPNVTKTLDYLIVGEFSSPNWLHESFGTKIRKAVEYRDEKYLGIRLLPESTWMTDLEILGRDLGVI